MRKGFQLLSIFKQFKRRVKRKQLCFRSEHTWSFPSLVKFVQHHLLDLRMIKHRAGEPRFKSREIRLGNPRANKTYLLLAGLSLPPHTGDELMGICGRGVLVWGWAFNFTWPSEILRRLSGLILSKLVPPPIYPYFLKAQRTTLPQHTAPSAVSSSCPLRGVFPC